MSAAPRRKGLDGERELVRLLRVHLGEAVVRNLSQCREGGCDLLGIAGWAVECQRAGKHPRLGQWWAQAVTQAETARLKPALAYRLDRQPWRVRVGLGTLRPEWGIICTDVGYTAELTLTAFAALVKEGLC